MLEEIINNPDLAKHCTTYEIGQTIFTEGDDSQDLYILVSGQLDILKGDQEMAEITEAGSLFGEIPFLLGSKRTFTAKAKEPVTTLRIPKEEITTFLHEFPSVSKAITKLLAQRLNETSQILYGLKEFCDQLPDAVILTDQDQKILSWNTAAEQLYGRDGDQMQNSSVSEFYEEPEVYNDFLEEVKSKHSISEKVLTIQHPEKGKRFISTSTTLLYDGHHNFQGVLSLGRDVTTAENLQRKYRRARYWLVPSFISFALLALVVFWGYPYFSKGYHRVDSRKMELRNQLAKDYLLLKSQLLNYYEDKDQSKTSQLMKAHFNIQETSVVPYTGLVLLDSDKKVFNAYSFQPDTDISEIIGSSYSGLEFKSNKKSFHNLLILYRASKDYPMGRKYEEIAFPMKNGRRFLGWLIFQMNIEMLEQEYGMNEVDLVNLKISEP
ncbi:cyclic nucleotide-binding domain-containing protein [Thermodesulfobacteriota bacterium]